MVLKNIQCVYGAVAANPKGRHDATISRAAATLNWTTLIIRTPLEYSNGCMGPFALEELYCAVIAAYER